MSTSLKVFKSAVTSFHPQRRSPATHVVVRSRLDRCNVIFPISHSVLLILKAHANVLPTNTDPGSVGIGYIQPPQMSTLMVLTPIIILGRCIIGVRG